MRATVFMVVLSMVLLSTAALADVPGEMNYQGTLTDFYGVALDTTVSMAFTIYDDSTGGSSIWTETQPSVVVVRSIFNVLLGSVNAIPDTVFDDPERWLGVQVGGDAEMTPRQKLVTVPYAFRAAKSDTADYAHSGGGGGADADGDWTIVGNDMYSAVSGYVGIGTTSPENDLDVHRSSATAWLRAKSDVGYAGFIIDRAAAAQNGYIIYRTGGIDKWYLGQIGAGSPNNDFAISTSHNPADGKFYLTQAGNLGIGTMSPNAKLHVSGDVNSDSLYKIKDYTVLATPRSFNNIHVGVGAGGSSTGNYETFLGRNAGSINEGNFNTFLGYNAGLFNTTGHSNTFAGLEAGYYNEDGTYNTFLGRSAGLHNTEADGNTFVGYYAGFFNETGSENTLLGNRAGLNTTGTSNTFIGSYTGYDNTSGNYNTFVGRQAGGKNTTGSSNVYVGNATGYNNTAGQANTFIGDYAGYNNTGTQNIFIGHYAGYYETGSHKLYIAEGPDTNDVTIYGDLTSGRIGLGTLDLGIYKLQIQDNGGASLKLHRAAGVNRILFKMDGNPVDQKGWAIDAGGGTFQIATIADDDVTELTRPMFIKRTGEIGIHKINPVATLDVEGTLDVSGEINTDAEYQINGIGVLDYSANNNVMVGSGAGENNTADYGTFIGDDAGLNNEGDYNTFLGYTAGYSNSTGFCNTFVGCSNGYDNTEGNYNTFLGTGAGRNNTTANDNTFVGYNAGYYNETGNYNTFLGTNAGLQTTGTSNTFIGHYTGYDNTGGNYNTLVGRYAGANNTTGSTNVHVGYASGYNNITGGGNVFIGNNAGYNETGSNRLYIDNSNTSSPLLWGDFTNNRLVINGNDSDNTNNRTFFANGQAGGTTAWYNDSDERLKKNINSIPEALQKVRQLRGVNFEWKDQEHHEPGQKMGFVAQEAVEVIPEVVSGEDGHYAMQYGPITALLVEAMKEQQEIIEGQQEQIAELTRRLAALER
jgi:hypothetical protein